MFPGVDGFSIDITTMVDIRDQTNKELAMRLVTDIQSGDVFYTDLNGFQVSPHADRSRRDRWCSDLSILTGEIRLEGKSKVCQCWLTTVACVRSLCCRCSPVVTT